MTMRERIRICFCFQICACQLSTLLIIDIMTTGSEEEQVTAILAAELIAIDSEIDHESVSEYISSIVHENTMDDEEKIEGIQEFLEESTSAPLDSFMSIITAQLSQINLDRGQAVEIANEAERQRCRDMEEKALRQDTVDAQQDDTVKVVLSKEERERRDAFLRQYEFVEETYTEDEGADDAVGMLILSFNLGRWSKSE